jgi:c-di-AMP phosphodiesterase-like protein
MSLKKRRQNGNMEQGLSFIAVIIFCMIAMFVFNSQLLFIMTFLVGSIYLIIRGRKKGWSWER